MGHRLASLDALRGATIAAMVLINDPAMGPPFLYHQLTHSPWNGWTFADVVFPAFLFMAGLSLPFSLARYLDGRAPRSHAIGRILRRCLLLVLLGLLVNGFTLLLGGSGGVWAHLRLPGVLQRIAVAYLIASLAALYLRPWAQAVLAVGLLLGYWGALEWVSVPGYGSGVLTPHGNLAAWIDRSVFGPAHMYGRGAPGYDPEGLVGSVVAAAGVLFGHWTGLLLRSGMARRVRVAMMAAGALACVGIGELWGHTLPVNKRMWTPSYVMLTTGLVLGALALSHLLFDGGGRLGRGAALPLRVLGANAIVIYVGSELTADALAHYHHAVNHIPDAPVSFWIWLRYLEPHWGGAGGSLVYAAAVLVAWWLVLGVLYWRRLFLRV